MFVYYINVPLNELGVTEMEKYDELMVNVETYELSQAEFDALRRPKGLFSKFDERFGTLIDVCEEERIELPDLIEALDVAKKFSQKLSEGAEKDGGEKVIKSLERAIQSETFWELDSYLE